MRFALMLPVLSLAKFCEIPKEVVVLLHEGEVFAVLEESIGGLVLHANSRAFLGKLRSTCDCSACGLPVLETKQQSTGALPFLGSH